ncbi:C45 family autoproteolytic acyltransferase/hydrolase [Chloroflexota bacterium]
MKEKNMQIPPNTPIHTEPPLLLTVKGSHLQMGQQIGEGASQQVKHSIENARIMLDSAYQKLRLTWDRARIQASKYMPFAQERYPQYVEELRGIAQGANVSFEDLAIVNAMEAVTTDAVHLDRCTSLAVNGDRTANGHVFAAHNEDWNPADEPDVYLVHATPDKEPPFLSMNYGGLLSNIGLNAYGIAQMCDSVYPSDSRIGVPRLFVSRAVLAASTPGEAITHMLSPRRAAGYNHVLVHESGELYNVEVSARRFAIRYGEDGYVAHTNNYLNANMQDIEKDPEDLVNSRVRYFRALRQVKRTPLHTLETLQAILKDHVNYPDSICNHSIKENSPLEDGKTINALIFDLTSRELHFAWGNPCANPFHTFRLSD